MKKADKNPKSAITLSIILVLLNLLLVVLFLTDGEMIIAGLWGVCAILNLVGLIKKIKEYKSE